MRHTKDTRETKVFFFLFGGGGHGRTEVKPRRREKMKIIQTGQSTKNIQRWRHYR